MPPKLGAGRGQAVVQRLQARIAELEQQNTAPRAGKDPT
jgi:hypothetical protein